MTTACRPADGRAAGNSRSAPRSAAIYAKIDQTRLAALSCVRRATPCWPSMLLVPATVNASALSSGSGSFTATGEVISVRQADGSTIVTATEVQMLTGVLNGTRVVTGIEVFQPDGTFTAHDSGTFTGTIGGRAGHH